MLVGAGGFEPPKSETTDLQYKKWGFENSFKIAEKRINKGHFKKSLFHRVS